MLKDEIRQEVGFELPITGGNGMYLEEAIVIKKEPRTDMYSVESAVQKYLFEKYCISWRLIRQELFCSGDRVYDRFFTFCEYKPDKPEHIDLTYLYFDITECWR